MPIYHPLCADAVHSCRRVAEDSIKNYQLWNHRRKLALALGPETVEQELKFCAGRFLCC